MKSSTPNLVVIGRSNGAPTLSCLLTGEPPRYLFVHGSSSSVTTWMPVMSAMADLGERCIAVDLRGHGNSAGREHLQRYWLQDYVGDVLAVMDAYPSIEVLVGHSMGGLICQLVAARVKIGHLILVASSPVGGMLKDGLRIFARHPATFLAACLTRSFARLYRKPAVARSLLFHPDTPEHVVETHLANVQEESWLGGIQLVWLLPKPGTVRCPVSVIGGTQDAMVSPTSVAATARAYGVSPVFVERTAHMLPIEADAQEIARLLINCVQMYPGHV